MDEVPVGRVTVIGAELAHRSHEDPILEGEAPDGYWLEEFWEGRILGEIGLERGEVLYCDRALRGIWAEYTDGHTGG